MINLITRELNRSLRSTGPGIPRAVKTITLAESGLYFGSREMAAKKKELPVHRAP
jgi:hypothetical protein